MLQQHPSSAAYSQPVASSMDDRAAPNVIGVSAAPALMSAAEDKLPSRPVLNFSSPCHAIPRRQKTSSSISTSGSSPLSRGESSNGSCPSGVQLLSPAAQKTSYSSSSSTISSSSSYRHAAVSTPGSVHDSVNSSIQQVVDVSVDPSGAVLQQKFEGLLAQFIGSCSSSCQCAQDARSLLQTFQHSKELYSTEQGQQWSTALINLSRLVPPFAAKLLDPAAHHKLVAAQDVLLVFTQHVVQPLMSDAGPADMTAGSRKWALGVALAANKPGGLCEQLCAQLHACMQQNRPRRQLRAVRDVSRSVQSHGQGVAAAAASTELPTGTSISTQAAHTAGSTPTCSTWQQVATQHQLAQLLLVYQWTAALCRIWPSSIIDAKALSRLLSSALGTAAKLVAQLPHMQTDQPALKVSRPVNPAASSSADVEAQSAWLAVPAVQRVQGSATKQDSGSHSRQLEDKLARSVAAAVLEVAAMVLEPLSIVLLQQQLAERQGAPSWPLSMSQSASFLYNGLEYDFGEERGGSTRLLEVMLTVCLHQLVLHAERKEQRPTQLCPGSSAQQGATFTSPACRGAATSGSTSSSSSSSSGGGRSIAQLAEGYLLQHADSLQAKQPAPSRAAVAAWRAVCENMWAAMSLPLTLQQAAVVLASAQPSAAAASSSGGDSNAGAAAAAVWDMQQCGPLEGCFGSARQHSPSTALRAHGKAGNSSTSSTSRRDSLGSSLDLPAAVSSEPILSIESCAHKVKHLSAVCLHLEQDDAFSNTTISDSSVANTLLAAAAAAVSLQGADALPLVATAVGAAWLLVQSKPPPQPHATAQPGPQVPTNDTQPEAVGAASPAGVAPVGNEWELCLSLAAKLTTAVLQLGVDPTSHSYREGSYSCVQLLLALLERLACHTDTALQLQQLQKVAYTLQLVEAAVRQHATSIKAEVWAARDLRGLGCWKQPGSAPRDLLDIAYGSAMSAVQLISKVDESVLGSLEGQQLLQSCTSLLITYSSITQHSQYTASPSDLALCVQLLQLLQRSEAQAAGCSSCGMSQSLAAGLALVGHCLVAVGAALSQPGTADNNLAQPTGAGISHSGTADSSLGNSTAATLSPPQQGDSSDSSSMQPSYWQDQQDSDTDNSARFYFYMLAWGAPTSWDQASQHQQQRMSAHASKLQQAIHDLLGCLQSISKAQQQHIPSAAAEEAAAICHSLPDQASSSLSASSSSSTAAGSSCCLVGKCAAGSAGDAAQHCGPWQPQQQQQHQRLLRHEATALADSPASRVLAGYHTALLALKAALVNLTDTLSGNNTRSIDAAILLPSQSAAMVAAGEALCAAVPSSACCSNPRCTNLSGVSAGFALVRGKGCVCGGCLGLQAAGAGAVSAQGALVAARYCSRACQAAHWQQHKELCNRLAHAAEAAAPDG